MSDFEALSRDRALGALLGLAVGDALGTTLEFSPRDSQPHHSEMIGQGPFDLAPGVWTDDTAMALALADNLLANGDLDQADLMRRFVAWWRKGEYSPTGHCFDIGNTTRQALLRFERTGDPRSGDTDPLSAGNGCLMRLSPVAIYCRHDMDLARARARQQSETTHAAAECLAASADFCGLLVHALNGASKERVLELALEATLPLIADGGWQIMERHQVRASGYVMDSLEAALWAVHNASSFEDALLRAVNLGDDADTVGAITGQLAGAIWGLSAIPERWLKSLAWKGQILKTAHALFDRKGAQGRRTAR